MNVPSLFEFSWHDLPSVLFAVILGVVLLLVVRQNTQDLLDLKATLAEQTD